MEPDAYKTTTIAADGTARDLTASELAAASAAISLKRIADVLEGSEKTVGIIGAIFESRNF